MLNSLFADYGEITLRLGFAVVLGSIIGLNRFLKHKAAGLRTHALVSLGSAMATLIAVEAPGADAQTVSRVLQGLVTGVGFIGAGVIMHNNGEERVQGLTTAASIWVAAVLGIACGVPESAVALVGTALVIAIFLLGKPIERTVARVLRREPDQLE